MSDLESGGLQHQFVDLHMHSTASDGALAPKDVVAAAKRAGLVAIALTDHDTLAGIPDAVAAGAACGIRVIAGAELSAVEADKETHILGLYLTEHAELERRLVEMRAMRVSRAARIVERLNAAGVPITMDAVLKVAAGGAVGRPHVARALLAGGWVGDFKEAFDRYLGSGKPAFVAKDQLPVAEAVAWIHAAGGLAVLAHPGSQGTRERVAQLVKNGLDGLEVLHPSNGWDDAQRLDALAAEFGLVRTGGSDWHGGTDGARTLGMMKVPAEWVKQHEARVAELAARRVA